MAMYYVIQNSDGDTRVDCITENVLKERLAEQYWGNIGFVDMNQLNKNNDTNYWGENIMIIKGDIVIPKEKSVVIEYDV